jgi:pyrroline-5-carboxylate reductase
VSPSALAFIGGGNMAGALIGGLRRGAGRASHIIVVEPQPERSAALAREHAVDVQAQIDAAVARADVIVLAVKPGQVHGVCADLRKLSTGALLLSVAAGIPSAAIAHWSGTDAVVRAMPNTPALIGEGITGAFARAGASAAQRDAAARTLEAVGALVWLEDEAMLDAVTAISGSGPGYVFYFIEALEQAALKMGLDAAIARQLAVRTFAGAAQLALRSDEDLAVLRERVTSKGGTTAAGLDRLRRSAVGESIIGAAQAALERSRALAREAWVSDAPGTAATRLAGEMGPADTGNEAGSDTGANSGAEPGG